MSIAKGHVNMIGNAPTRWSFSLILAYSIATPMQGVA